MPEAVSVCGHVCLLGPEAPAPLPLVIGMAAAALLLFLQVLEAFTAWLKLAGGTGLTGDELTASPLVAAALSGLRSPDTFFEVRRWFMGLEVRVPCSVCMLLGCCLHVACREPCSSRPPAAATE